MFYSAYSWRRLLAETREGRVPLSSVGFVTVILSALPLLAYADMFIAERGVEARWTL